MIAAVILSGGQSKRMGIDKALLKVSNETLLEHMQNLLNKSGFKHVFVSGHTGIQDKYQNSGPLAGIIASLNYLIEYSYVLFVPVDMPLLNSDILLNLVEKKTQVPVHYENNKLPFIINNTKSNRVKIETQIQKNKLALYQLFKLLKVKKIEYKNENADNQFINTNTPEQWLKFKESLPK